MGPKTSSKWSYFTPFFCRVKFHPIETSLCSAISWCPITTLLITIDLGPAHLVAGSHSQGIFTTSKSKCGGCEVLWDAVRGMNEVFAVRCSFVFFGHRILRNIYIYIIIYIYISILYGFLWIYYPGCQWHMKV